MKNEFYKKDLMTGDVVLSTKGSYGVVLRNTAAGMSMGIPFDEDDCDYIKWFKNKKGEIIHKVRDLNTLSNEMVFKGEPTQRIIKVYRPTDPHDVTTMAAIAEKYLIWEYKVKEVTVSELEKLFGCKVKIVKED